ncbi:MAG: hypothetical protein AAF558_15030 [Verrucomicrobiota bacterium]
MPNKDLPICDCESLWQCAKDPENPIQFDEEMNEFHLVYGKSKMMIYHCHFCGGRVPVKSKRSSLFSQPTHGEREKLMKLVEGISTLEDTLKVLGDPDEDFPTGEAHTTPPDGDEPEKTVFFRTLRYKGLSNMADMRVRVYPTDKVQFIIESKYIGPKK